MTQVVHKWRRCGDQCHPQQTAAPVLGEESIDGTDDSPILFFIHHALPEDSCAG